MFTKRIPLKQRFAKFIKRSTQDRCWIWLGAPNSSGYGTIRLPGRNGKTITAHRLAYIYEHGAVPDGMCVCHHCDNRICVNPSHLFVGTNADNVADRDKKGRCRSRGFPGELCGRHKLNNSQVLSALKDTRTHQIIADEFGVARSTITNIKNRRTWRHLRTIGKWTE